MEMQKPAHNTAPESLKARTLDQLLELWSQVDAMPMTEEMPIVRGWIIDELKNRSHVGWGAWMDNGNTTMTGTTSRTASSLQQSTSAR